jgi:glycosyltransferase involved in cell wall biosynthesis
MTPLSEPGTDELRVLLVANTLSHNGGAEVMVFNIYNALKHRPGVKVKLVTFKYACYKNEYDIPGLKEILYSDPDFLDSDSYVSLSVFKPNKIDVSQFVEVVNSFKPHVIHSHLFMAELISHEVIFPGIKYFTHCHDSMPQLRNFSLKTLTQKKLFTDFFEKRHLVKKYLQCNNKFIAISADTKTYFENVLPQKLKGNVSLLDNAIVTKNFYGAGIERGLGTIRIINVGSFIPIKNQQFLVDITRVLVNRGHKVEVTMLGIGAEYEKVKAKVAANNLENVISMPGTKPNVADYYAAANVCVHVCTLEGFGLVFLEAMASGLPVVSLDGKGNRSLIKDGENGFMLDNQNPEAFADAIEKVVSDKKVYAAMSANAAAFAKKYDIEEYVNKLINLYRLSTE